MTKQQIISILADIWQAEYKRTHYLVSVGMAQCIVESGWFTSGLTKVGNILGMKSSLLNSTWSSIWDGTSVSYDTTEEYTPGTITNITDLFRSYVNCGNTDVERYAACIHDYCLFMHSPKYAGVTNITDPRTLITTISNKGYATASTYTSAIMRVIDQYNLTQYDIKEVEQTVTSDFIKWVNGWTRYNFTRRDRVPTHICLHYTANPFSTAEQNANYYNTCQTAHASADFFVDEISVIGLNQDIPHFYSWATGKKWFDGVHGAELWNIATIDKTISIEMCCKTKSGRKSGLAPNDPDWYFEPKTVENTKQLVMYLMETYNIPASNITTHYHICGKTCPGILGWNTNGTNENEFLALVEDCKNGVITSEDTIKDWQSKLISVGFDCGTKKGKPDGDWGRGSKSDCLDFCTLYGLDPVDTPNNAVLAKLDDILSVTDPVIFDYAYYAAKNKDLKKAGVESKAQLTAHWYNNGIKEGNRKSSPVFSLTYYKKKYPDLDGLDNRGLINHFLKNGMSEGRQASSEFKLYKYYLNYSDLRKAFGELYTNGQIDPTLVKKNGEKYYRHFATLGYNETRVANKTIM